MKRIFTRSKGLLLIIALAVVAAMWITVPAYAASSASAGRMSTATGHSASSAAPCDFTLSLKTCESTDPKVTYTSNATGDTSHCTFVFKVTWGDGGSTTKTETDPSDGHHLIGDHKYVTSGAYTIKVNVRTTVGACTATSSAHTFTLLVPDGLPSKSDSWAGYVAAGSGPYHHVQATWKMPGNKGTKAQEAATDFWVGFDGDTPSSNNIEQCGTQILEASDGEIAYVTFYEVGLKKGAIQHPKFLVFPDDAVTAVADYGNGAFRCTFRIKHHGVVRSWSTGPIKGKFPLATAEVITEAPGAPTLNPLSGIPLAPFGAVKYTDVSLGQGTVYPLAMYTIDGLSEAVSTSQFQGTITKGSFTNTYIRSEVGVLLAGSQF